MSKHTEGPWTWTEKGNEDVVMCPTHIIATIERRGAGWCSDARLIAAAPEMYAALREAESYAELKLEGFRRDYSEDHAMVQTPLRLLATLRAAIARAEGRDT